MARFALRDLRGGQRSAYFVCVIAATQGDRMLAVVSARVDGEIVTEPKGSGGFGYDPIFYMPELHATFAEISGAEKSRVSHRGKAFRRLLDVLR